VVDPPWPSKSRGKHYKTMALEDIKRMKLSSKIAPGGIVAVWVTNSDSLVRFTEKELMKAWGLELCATWYWLKVTCKGQLQTPMLSPHKKPFEQILIGRKVSTTEQSELPSVPNNFCIVSQAAQHSRKPFLGEILSWYCGVQCAPTESLDGIEIFAREMHSSWCSIGDQVLHFHEVTDDGVDATSLDG